MRSITRIISTFCIALSFSLFVGCIDDDGYKDFELGRGEALPNFSIVNNLSDTITTSDFKGKIGIIVFFNTSCPDCRAELPVVQRVYERYASDDRYLFLCVSRGESVESVSAFWNEQGLTIPYSAQSSKSVFNKFASHTVPRIFISDRRGVVAASFDDNPIASETDLLSSIRSVAEASE